MNTLNKEVNKDKEIVCTLKGDYRDIRTLRKIKGLSIKELAEMMFRTESYLNQVENGKVNISNKTYNQIFNLLGFEKVVKTKISITDIQEQIKNKGAMYMRNSNKELAKQMILNHISERKEECDIEGVLACLELVNLIDNKNPVIEIKEGYAVYDGTDCGNYDLVGSEYILDVNKLVKYILEDVEYLLDNAWSVPTTEGSWIDIYHINPPKDKKVVVQAVEIKDSKENSFFEYNIYLATELHPLHKLQENPIRDYSDYIDDKPFFKSKEDMLNSLSKENILNFIKENHPELMEYIKGNGMILHSEWVFYTDLI